MTVKKGKLMMLALTASLSAAGLWGCRGEAAYLTGGQAQSAEESGTEETSEDEIAAGGTSEEETDGFGTTADLTFAGETSQEETQLTESIQVTGSADRSAPSDMALYRSSLFIWNEEEWSLELYVPEEALADGELMLDDLCRFQIRAVSPDRVYVLFDDSVQLGTPAGDVWTDEEGRLHIVIRDVRTALYRITDFVYDGEQDGFEGQAVIDREGINYWGTVTGQ